MSDAFSDPYVYRGGTVLKNTAGLRDAALLESFELEMTALRADEPLPVGRYDAAHYRAIHRHLFQDVYRWAGRYRTVRIARGGSAFCYPEHIVGSMERLFERLRAAPFTGGDAFDAFAGATADVLSELNAIHPFRDGNGRSQLVFLHMIALRAGHALDLSRVTRETVLPAMIAGFHGDAAPLTRLLHHLRA